MMPRGSNCFRQKELVGLRVLTVARRLPRGERFGRKPRDVDVLVGRSIGNGLRQAVPGQVQENLSE